MATGSVAAASSIPLQAAAEPGHTQQKQDGQMISMQQLEAAMQASAPHTDLLTSCMSDVQYLKLQPRCGYKSFWPVGSIINFVRSM